MSDDLHEPDSQTITVTINREAMDELVSEGRALVPGGRDTPDVAIRVVDES